MGSGCVPLCAFATWLMSLSSGAQSTFLVSVSSEGQPGYENSYGGEVTPDGRFLVFSSKAKNLVPDDTNDVGDVFVHDRWQGTTERASLGVNGVQAKADCRLPTISADGRLVAFESAAENLVPGDANGALDVFLRDRTRGTTTCISAGLDGLPGNGLSRLPRISADGTRICFESYASNLIEGDTNSIGDVFVHDTTTGVTRRVSVSSTGAQAVAGAFDSAISADGRWAAFSSGSWDLVSGDHNQKQDAFVHDLLSGSTHLVSLAWDGTQANNHCYEPRISGNGRSVAFTSTATNLVRGGSNGDVQAFVRDRRLGTTTQVSVSSDGVESNDGAGSLTISDNGRCVAFASLADNLVQGDTNNTNDVFLRDLWTGTTERISMGFDGSQANSFSGGCSLDHEGRRVIFGSAATNLTPNDFNNREDVFLHDRSSCEPTVGSYCQASQTSIAGCQVPLASTGTPSVSFPQSFTLAAGPAPGQVVGALYWSTLGASASPIGTQGGLLCAQQPLMFCTPISSGGHSALCDGSFSFTLQDLMRSAPATALGGATVHAGIWFRDPASPDGFGLSDALWFQVCP